MTQRCSVNAVNAVLGEPQKAAKVHNPRKGFSVVDRSGGDVNVEKPAFSDALKRYKSCSKCDHDEIRRELNVPLRTVKSWFSEARVPSPKNYLRLAALFTSKLGIVSADEKEAFLKPLDDCYSLEEWYQLKGIDRAVYTIWSVAFDEIARGNMPDEIGLLLPAAIFTSDACNGAYTTHCFERRIILNRQDLAVVRHDGIIRLARQVHFAPSLGEHRELLLWDGGSSERFWLSHSRPNELVELRDVSLLYVNDAGKQPVQEGTIVRRWRSRW